MTSKEFAIQYAFQFIGVPYEWGGDNAQGLDCSGFVGVILRSVGVMKNREDLTAQGIREKLKGYEEDFPRAGNIVFYGAGDHATHVGFMVSDNEILEAGGGGSKTTSLKLADDHNAFVRGRPFDYRKIMSMAHPFTNAGRVHSSLSGK
ncbi:C40 family peptidase [bacterium]|nr:C40 family peptidase [bacterium]